jgi:hypothetical protein
LQIYPLDKTFLDNVLSLTVIFIAPKSSKVENQYADSPGGVSRMDLPKLAKELAISFP